MNLILKLLAPYLAVGIFWNIFQNGWLAILAYHAQVLFWNRTTIFVGREGLRPFQPYKKRWLLAALPTLAGGPLVYFLLPHITHTELSTWLAEYKLTGLSLALMVPYFGIIHPVVEQLHWEPLREQTPVSHFFFAGYHLLVLRSLVTAPWMLFCFALLAAASFFWQFTSKRSGSLATATLSHILADLGIILTAYWMAAG